jgi:dihydrofolate reductase
MDEAREELGLVVAMTQNGVIGASGDLPWRLPDDLKHFKATTLGHCLIMGRKTWDSLPGALPGRTSIVVTRNPTLELDGAERSPSVPAAIALARGMGDSEPMIAGGAEIYALALPFVTHMWITRVLAEVDGDTVFPSWDPQGWESVSSERHAADLRHEHAFTIEEWRLR